MSSSYPRRKRTGNILWFTVPATVMLLTGFGILLYVALGPRLSDSQGVLIPTGFATAGLGGALLTRSLISVFSLCIYALIGLVFAFRALGFLHPLTWVFVSLVPFCVALAKRADS